MQRIILRHFHIFMLLVLAGTVLAGCTTVRESNPARTATEQLLISTAAERAARQLEFGVPPATRVYVDAANFDGTDAKYAVAAIREEVLREGLHLTNDRSSAEAVIEIRAGVLSIDQREFLVGIPEFDVPVPLTGDLGIPELALYKNDLRQGVAKFSSAAYETGNGRLIAVSAPPAQSAFEEETSLLFFITWRADNLNRPRR